MFGKIKSGNTKNSRHHQLYDVMSIQPTVAADTELQDKIIAYFSNGKKIEALEVAVTAGQRENVTNQLRDGKISERELSEFLRQVVSKWPNHDTPEMIFQQISQLPKQKQILSVITGHNAANWQTVSVEDLKNLLTQPLSGQPDYRTPLGFAKFRTKFLAGIKAQATPEQMSAYCQAMDGLERKLYGKSFDFYQQIQLLQQDSLGISEEMLAEAFADPSDDANIQEIITEELRGTTLAVAPTIQATKPLPSTSSWIALSPERSNEILNRAMIDGDPWVQDGNEYRLGGSTLVSSGLTPAFEMSVNDQGMAFSTPFQLGDGRGAVLGYIYNNDGAKVRSYYINPKTGLWHFAPDTIRGARGEGLGQIGEGYGLTSTMLHFALQKGLSDLVKERGFREITNVNPDFLFAGTAPAYNNLQDLREAIARGQARNDFYREVDNMPILSNWQSSGKNKNAPQLISVNTYLAPNFQAPVIRFGTYSTLAGQVLVDCFPSRDGQATWVFCSDDWSRCWLGNLEISSPITSTGCHRDWAQAGDLATPIYEYSTQAAGYGDPSDTRKGGLVGMWNQYLSKIPLMQEYLSWRNQNR